MKKAIDFVISAEFGIFRIPELQDPSLTFEFIPKSAILGICGAILGLEGYSSGKKNPEFLSALSEFEVAVTPYSKGEPAKIPFRKSLVTFTNFHGYGNVDGPWICTEQVLIRPAYRLTIIADDSNPQFSKLVKLMKTNQTSFRPYFGKNEFLANLEFIGVFDVQDCVDDKVRCSSIYPVSSQGSVPSMRRGQPQPGTFKIFDNYAFSIDQNGRYVQKLFCFTDWEIFQKQADLSVGRFYRLTSGDKRAVFAF